MPQNFKDSTRKSIRDHIHGVLDKGLADSHMTIEVLAERAGINIRRVGDILLNSHNPTVDEAAMMYLALGIPLKELVAYIDGLSFFQRKTLKVVAA